MGRFNLLAFAGSTRAQIICAIIAPILGFFCMLLPVIPVHGLDYEKDYLVSSVMRHIVENQVPVPTAILIFITGMLVGFLSIRFWWFIGPWTMAAFPMIAFSDMLRWPISHNLWFIEFIFYGVFCIPGFVGAFIGSRIGRRMKISEVTS